MSQTLTAHDTPAKIEMQPATNDDLIVKQAITILERRLFSDGPVLTSPDTARDYLRLKLVPEPNEVFVAVFLTAKHQVIACETLFRGTIDGAEVHPRVVVQRALALNASALIVSHQHPSGESSPSPADRTITARLKQALSLVDVRLLDHYIIGRGVPYSFASHGLL